MALAKNDTVKPMAVPTQAEREVAAQEVDQKLTEIRELFKQIEGLADLNRLHVTWDGLDNMDNDHGWYSQARIHYIGAGTWRSSSRDDC